MIVKFEGFDGVISCIAGGGVEVSVVGFNYCGV